MKWAISTAIDSKIANSFLSRMHIYMGKSIIIIEKERLIRERSSQEKRSNEHNYMSLVVRKRVSSSGFPTRSDTNRAVQPLKIARGVKLLI